MPTPAEITRHHDDTPPPGAPSPWLPGREQWEAPKQIVEPDPTWPAQFAEVERLVRGALGSTVLELNHVGSTSVPGLPAKPVIDADLVVTDPNDESAYVPQLVEVGFFHQIREPWWHGHRLLKLRTPFTHLHVFGPDCPEVIRHRMFKEWLTDHADDRATYAEAKRAAMAATGPGETGMDYNVRKEDVVRAIYDRMFRALGLLTD